MTEVIKPKSKAMTNEEREQAKNYFFDRYGHWYWYTYKKYANYTKSWLEQFDKQSEEDKQGW